MASPEQSTPDQPETYEIGIGSKSGYGALALPVVQGPDGMLILDAGELRGVLNEQHRNNPFENPLLFIPLTTCPQEPAAEPEPRQDGEPRAYTLKDLESHRTPTSFFDGKVVVNPLAYQIEYDGSPLKFSPKGFRLVQLLSMEPGRVFTRPEIITGVWGYDFVTPSLINNHTYRVRKELPKGSLITTREVGYGVAP